MLGQLGITVGTTRPQDSKLHLRPAQGNRQGQPQPFPARTPPPHSSFGPGRMGRGKWLLCLKMGGGLC